LGRESISDRETKGKALSECWKIKIRLSFEVAFSWSVRAVLFVTTEIILCA